MITLPIVALLFVIVICLGTGFFFGYWKREGTLPPFEPATPGSPQIVVNVPAEFKPLDTLPPTAIEGVRAQLWYTVFQASLDDGSANSVAVYAANEAVDKVFGSAP